ncbi:hypothetical protein COCMIDRAFT_24674 [Bipolaris oryzae ATCC 44560]|uniref:UBA domain-containing protein n=1 Tax=Bipolaris oryzae ATCC 44560 TaxID=930090 RepID=W6ZJ76_COCMI|nr:uncharacterized protein COCMIDRAFT_24674 [Bipolaris oryzae ATCC 44560]EUC47514.1 hypothetical protein COCMIDRAFT_24674 [Bipolaris oryzae ATCC 44560]
MSVTTLTITVDSLHGNSRESLPIHLQSIPSQDEPQSSVSLPEHPNKRRKTESPSQLANGYEPANFHEAVWQLEGTMRNDYVGHQPVMFGEPSSTIPNATMTQQRVLEAVNGPVMLGQESEAGELRHHLPPEPSVPWSDLMRFTPAEETKQTESPRREPPPPHTSLGTPVVAMEKSHRWLATQGNKCASSSPSNQIPSKNGCSTFEGHTVDDEPVNAKTNLPLVSVKMPTTRPESHTNDQAEAKISPGQHKSWLSPNSDDELSAIGLPEERYKPRPSRSRSLKVDTEESIDYSVRPEKAAKLSKRRRTTADMRAANAITTPEKVRQICDMGFTPSTTAGALKRNNGDVIQTVDWLVTNNIGHDELAPQSPPKPKRKSKEEDEPEVVDVQTVQSIMRNLDEYRRDNCDTAQYGQSAGPDADSFTTDLIDVNTSAETSNPHECSETDQNMSPTKVQVVIPKKSPKATVAQAEDAIGVSSKKSKRKKSTLDQTESESVSSLVPIPAPMNEKKRGRGRPKKTPTTSDAIEPIVPLEQEAKEEQPNEPEQPTEQNLVTEKVDPSSVIAPDEPQPVEPVISRDTEQVNVPTKVNPAPTSETPEKSTKPATPSPMTKGKVPYRVGLSKRARIAPLLRTLKK